MTPYTTAALTALLAKAGLTPYAAAPLAGVTARQMQRAAKGEQDLGNAAWVLLQVSLSRAARRALPAPVLP